MNQHENAVSDGTSDEANVASTGLRKSSLLLIGAGVVVFGLIIGDRVLNMLRVGDLPDSSAEIARVIEPPGSMSQEKQSDVANEISLVSDSAVEADDGDQAAAQVADVSEAEVADVVQIEDPAADAAENNPPVIEDVFGARLMFVSQSEPVYVITANDQRIDLGGNVDEDTVLSGLTSDSVIVDRNGELMVLSLPAPGEFVQ